VANVNFTDSTSYKDIYGHGTHVAGIAAAIPDNSIGIAGLGYDATIMNVKVLGDDGKGSYSWIAQGIVWAADNGAKVINMSLGGTSPSSTLEDAINYAWSKGAVVVAAAGNSGTSSPFYPACYSKAIAVAATDQIDKVPSWSNYGDWVDVAAPGNGIYSTLANSSYGYKTGTSMASPFVSGLAALVFTVVRDTNGNRLLNDEVRTQIEANCDDIGVSGIGNGRINAYKSVSNFSTSAPAPLTGNVSGIVIDAIDGFLIAQATVTCGTLSAVTTAEGLFAISDLIAGSYILKAAKDGYSTSPQEITVVAGQTHDVSFELNRIVPMVKSMFIKDISFVINGKNLVIKVKVVEDAGAVAGAMVELTAVTGSKNWLFIGVTDSSGNISFTINKAPAGTYTVTLTSLYAAGYEWDTSQGVISAEFTISGSTKANK